MGKKLTYRNLIVFFYIIHANFYLFLTFLVLHYAVYGCCLTTCGLTLAGVSQKFGREQTMMLPAHCQPRTHLRWRQTAR